MLSMQHTRSLTHSSNIRNPTMEAANNKTENFFFCILILSHIRDRRCLLWFLLFIYFFIRNEFSIPKIRVRRRYFTLLRLFKMHRSSSEPPNKTKFYDIAEEQNFLMSFKFFHRRKNCKITNKKLFRAIFALMGSSCWKYDLTPVLAKIYRRNNFPPSLAHIFPPSLVDLMIPMIPWQRRYSKSNYYLFENYQHTIHTKYYAIYALQ